MATGDYNSPYTGAQLDDTIRKISSNEIHTYVKVFDNASGTASVSVNSLPAGPNGLRTGVYDVIYAASGSTNSKSVSRILVSSLNVNAAGTGHSNTSGGGGSDVHIWMSAAGYVGANKEFRAEYDEVNVTAGTASTANALYIYEMYRQDTIA